MPEQVLRLKDVSRTSILLALGCPLTQIEETPDGWAYFHVALAPGLTLDALNDPALLAPVVPLLVWMDKLGRKVREARKGRTR